MNYPNKIELILTYRHNLEDTEIFTEKVDAVKTGDYYKLIHVPAFAHNIAYGDIVEVEFDDGEFHFDNLIEESGYSVVHIIIWQAESKDRVASTLNDFGCGVNTHVADNYVVVSIAPEFSYFPVQEFLLTEKTLENIDFKEACLSKTHAIQV